MASPIEPCEWARCAAAAAAWDAVADALAALPVSRSDARSIAARFRLDSAPIWACLAEWLALHRGPTRSHPLRRPSDPAQGSEDAHGREKHAGLGECPSKESNAQAQAQVAMDKAMGLAMGQACAALAGIFEGVAGAAEALALLEEFDVCADGGGCGDGGGCAGASAALPCAILVPDSKYWFQFIGYDAEAVPLGLVRVSLASLGKQARKHPDITRELYESTQELLELSPVVKERRNGYTRHLLFLPRLMMAAGGGGGGGGGDGDGEAGSSCAVRPARYKIVVKTTVAGTRLYLVSFHRLNDDELDAIVSVGIELRGFPPPAHLYSSYELV